MDQALLITSFVTMFVVVDPIGLAPMFVALTQGMDGRARAGAALRACLTGVGVLAAFAVVGETLLGFVGISMAAFRISGGFLLFITALDMLFERRTKRREGQASEDDHTDPSIFPLGIPLIAGPGAIASIILLSGHQDSWAGTGIVIGCMVGVIALVYVLFRLAGVLETLLGRTGILVVTRILGLLLAALSVQFVLDGLRDVGVIPLAM